MRARPIHLAALAALAAACGAPADDRPRLLSEEDHLSVVAPPSWSTTREYGSLVFVAPKDGPARGATIAIRAVRVEGDWTEARTAALVVPATERVLAALPRAQVTALDQAVDTGDFTGAAFLVSFVPEGGKRRVERRHVVLSPKDGAYLYHVFLTAPAGRLDTAKDVFADVVATLREDV